MGPARRTTAKAAPARSLSRSEIKTEQLFRSNAGFASDPALADQYDAISVRYFNGALPSVRVRWEERLDEIGPLIAEGFRLEGVTNGRVILLHPALEDDAQQLRRVLCHEVAHVALSDRSDGHGPRFQTLLRRLGSEGAFEGLVATDEEKADLRALLERRTQEMDRESSRLRAAWSELDAADAARVEEYNSHVGRLQDAAADFNRLVARYNLMISYPDGLDEERLAHRATPLSTK
jgi:SprT-like family.